MRICKTCFEKKEIERFEKTDGYYRHKCKDCANAKRRTGKTRSSFPKGHIPWNKGLEGYKPENPYRYEKGHIPWSKGKKDFLRHIRKSENRYGGKDVDWKTAVKNRDGNKCTKCDSTYRLAAHHIKPWKEHPELRFDIENGISLCCSCHASLENKGKQSPLKGKKTGISWNRGMKGMQKAWNKGIPMSDEQKEKLRNAKLGRPGVRKGMKHSEETKRKISETKRIKHGSNKC